jgi:hypothetical protein
LIKPFVHTDFDDVDDDDNFDDDDDSKNEILF